jgi:hypothetical protein
LRCVKHSEVEEKEFRKMIVERYLDRERKKGRRAQSERETLEAAIKARGRGAERRRKWRCTWWGAELCC